MTEKNIDEQLAARVIALLNEALSLDSEAVTALVNSRVRCNEGLACHPTIQVGTRDDGSNTVGLVGVLNGLCGVDADGWGPIAVSIEEDTGRVLGFLRTPPRPPIEGRK